MTHEEIAANFGNWREWFDCYGNDTEEDFNNRTFEQRLQLLQDASGPEQDETLPD